MHISYPLLGKPIHSETLYLCVVTSDRLSVT